MQRIHLNFLDARSDTSLRDRTSDLGTHRMLPQDFLEVGFLDGLELLTDVIALVDERAIGDAETC